MIGRRDFLGTGAVAFALPLLNAQDSGISTRVAIQKVCAWPKLRRIGDGALLVFIFNQPCHGLWEGDLECWASLNGGMSWKLRSRVTAHEPGTVRMNCAAGEANNGDLIVLCGGWDGMCPPQKRLAGPSKPIPIWVCRSSDRGHTWTTSNSFP